MIDSQVITLISNSLESKLSETFYCETAAELWQAIENQFSNKNSHSQIYYTKKEITQIVQKSKSILELVGHVRAKYEELKLYKPPTTNLTVLQERKKTDRVYTFLAALDSNYEAIKAQLLLSTEKLTFNDVTAWVQNEATRGLAMNPSTDLNAAENKACVAQNPNSNLRDESRPRGLRTATRDATIAKNWVTIATPVGFSTLTYDLIEERRRRGVAHAEEACDRGRGDSVE